LYVREDKKNPAVRTKQKAFYGGRITKKE